MRDIDIKCEDGNFKFRVSAIIIKDNKLLVENSLKKDGYYVLPGGHIEFGEISSEALLREVEEEVKIKVKILNLFCVLENIYYYKNKINQEINCFYKVECLEELEDIFETEEIDKGINKHHKFEFIPIEKLNNLRPSVIMNMIKENINYENKIVLLDERKLNN